MTSIGIEIWWKECKTKSILRFNRVPCRSVHSNDVCIAGTSLGVGKHSPFFRPIFQTKRHRHHLSFAHVLWHDGMVRHRNVRDSLGFSHRAPGTKTMILNRGWHNCAAGSRWEKPLGWLYLSSECSNLKMTSLFPKFFVWLGHVCFFPKYIWHSLHSMAFFSFHQKPDWK